jgi:hypothetical protein
LANLPYFFDEDLRHTNCGVPNKWFYLFCEGQPADATSPEIVGVGRPLAARILYRMLSDQMIIESSQFIDARTASEDAARNLCGEFTQHVYSTALAWFTRGVGSLPPFPYVEPNPGADHDVLPWKTDLRWPAGSIMSAYETEWKVEIATDKDFTTDLNILLTNKTEQFTRCYIRKCPDSAKASNNVLLEDNRNDRTSCGEVATSSRLFHHRSV